MGEPYPRILLGQNFLLKVGAVVQMLRKQFFRDDSWAITTTYIAAGLPGRPRKVQAASLQALNY